jgi:hypothetical protein
VPILKLKKPEPLRLKPHPEHIEQWLGDRMLIHVEWRCS